MARCRRSKTRSSRRASSPPSRMEVDSIPGYVCRPTKSPPDACARTMTVTYPSTGPLIFPSVSTCGISPTIHEFNDRKHRNRAVLLVKSHLLQCQSASHRIAYSRRFCTASGRPYDCRPWPKSPVAPLSLSAARQPSTLNGGFLHPTADLLKNGPSNCAPLSIARMPFASNSRPGVQEDRPDLQVSAPTGSPRDLRAQLSRLR